jgi:hypothetical protein
MEKVHDGFKREREKLQELLLQRQEHCLRFVIYEKQATWWMASVARRLLASELFEE